jgi:hypothetical protein
VEDWPRLQELGDTLVVNFAAYPLAAKYPDLLPHYYLCMDDPDKFHVPWHETAKVRSLIAVSRLKRFASRWKNVQSLHWPGWMTAYKGLKPEVKAKHTEKDWEFRRKKQKAQYLNVNPFRDVGCPMHYKSVLYGARYLTTAGYDKVFFYGCDFLPDQKQWYANSASPLDDKQFGSKCRSNEQQLSCLLQWYPFAQEQGCDWISLSPISRLSHRLPYQPL